MKDIHCVLDACTIINLIHIDEEDFVLKRLNRLNIHASNKVQKEVRRNFFNKYEDYKFQSDEERENKINELEKKVTFFHRFIYHNESIKRELGEDYFEEVKELTDYEKENGEFYSTALCLFLSREKEIKLVFHTDDYPAIDHFLTFFNYQKIGTIENSADLLILLYIHSDSDLFPKSQLKKLLTNLYQEYATDVKKLEKSLENFISGFSSSKLLNNKSLRFNVNSLLKKLRNLKFSNINKLKENLLEEKNDLLTNILKKYSSVFELETSRANNPLSGIKAKVNKLEKNEIYKFY